MSEATETAGFSPYDVIAHTGDIVCAFISNNHVQSGDLPGLIHEVHAALSVLATGGAPAGAAAEPEVTKPSPAEIRKSIRPDGIVSFIDGKAYRTMKRHLTRHGLDPKSYRERYGLPADYPMVSANYSAQRSELAKALGLGQPGARAKQASDAGREGASKARSRGRKAPEAEAA